MSKFFLVSCFLLISIMVSGQDLWEREYSVHSNTTIFSAIEAPSGDLYMSVNGFINNLEGSETRLLKLDETGDIIWSRELRLLSHDWLGDIHITEDGNIICGNYLTDLPNQDYGFGISYVSSDGELIWFRGFSRDLYEGVLAIDELQSGEFVAISTDRSLESESILIRFDLTGEEMSFSKLVVQDEPVFLADVRPISNSQSFYIAGDVFDPQVNRQVAFIARINNETVEWSKTYDIGFDLYEDYGVSYMRVLDSGQIVFGLSIEPDSDISNAIIMVDSTGEFLWAKGFTPDPNSNFEWNVGMETDSLDNIYYSLYSFSGSAFSCLTKWDAQGNLLFAKKIQDNEQKALFFETILHDGRMLMTGGNSYGPILATTGQDGEIACGEIPWEENITDEEVTTNEVSLFLSEVAVDTLDTTPTVTEEIEQSVLLCSSSLSTGSEANILPMIYPNPSDGNILIDFTNTVNHKIDIFSLSGEKLLTINDLYSRQQLNLKNKLDAGVYILSIDNVHREKIVIR